MGEARPWRRSRGLRSGRSNVTRTWYVVHVCSKFVELGSDIKEIIDQPCLL